VYVALSRCKSFEGLVLSSPITLGSIKTDDTIAEFSNDINTNPPGQQELADSKFTFQKSLLYELFDYKKIQNSFNYFKKNITDNASIIDASVLNDLSIVEIVALNEIYSIAEKFKLQLEQLSVQNILPEENSDLQERVKKASVYFAEKTDTILYAFTRNINFETDNKAIKKAINESLEYFQKEIFIKYLCLKLCINGFKTIEYLKVKSNAEIDFKASLKTVKATKASFAKDLLHAPLYAELRQWRDIIADEHNYPVYMVLPHKAMMELLKHLPTSLPELETIKGIGKKKVKQFGNEIIELIREYCESNGIDKPQIEIKIKPVKNKAVKPDSKKLSFEMSKAGKTIHEIAKERNFSIATIEGHLAHYVSTGDLDIASFVSKEKVKIISDYFAKNKTTSISKAKADLENSVSYSELKFVMNHLEYMGRGEF
jgi:uncharacterized protein YpbB